MNALSVGVPGLEKAGGTQVAKGQDLVLPRDFIKYGFAKIARDVATESLSTRTPADERRALDRDRSLELRATQHTPEICVREIRAFEQQRHIQGFGQRIGETVSKI